ASRSRLVRRTRLNCVSSTTRTRPARKKEAASSKDGTWRRFAGQGRADGLRFEKDRMQRAQTLLLCLLLLNALLGTLCLAVGRGARRSAALVGWGAALLTYAG